MTDTPVSQAIDDDAFQQAVNIACHLFDQCLEQNLVPFIVDDTGRKITCISAADDDQECLSEVSFVQDQDRFSVELWVRDADEPSSPLTAEEKTPIYTQCVLEAAQQLHNTLEGRATIKHRHDHETAH